MAGYWRSPFLCVYGPRLRLGPSVVNAQKEERGQYPVILTSLMVNNPYIYITQTGAVKH